jgi:hypothetical protein
MSDADPGTNFIKWLLEADIRVKNALSVLFALFVVGATYFLGRGRAWFREIAERGLAAQAVALVLILVSAFLAAWLAITAVSALWGTLTGLRKARERERERLKTIFSILQNLTDWQRSFLLRFVVEDRTQIPEWEIGGYQAVWGPEVEVLLAKGILIRYGSGVFELNPVFWAFLQNYWDPETSRLMSPEVPSARRA